MPKLGLRDVNRILSTYTSDYQFREARFSALSVDELRRLGSITDETTAKTVFIAARSSDTEFPYNIEFSNYGDFINIHPPDKKERTARRILSGIENGNSRVLCRDIRPRRDDRGFLFADCLWLMSKPTFDLSAENVAGVMALYGDENVTFHASVVGPEEYIDSIPEERLLKATEITDPHTYNLRLFRVGYDERILKRFERDFSKDPKSTTRYLCCSA